MAGKKPDPERRPTPRKPRREVTGLLGIGLDGKDGHSRITKGDDFFLVGGSAETHERMQDLTIRITEQLGKKGKRIRDATPDELRELADDLDD